MSSRTVAAQARPPTPSRPRAGLRWAALLVLAAIASEARAQLVFAPGLLTPLKNNPRSVATGDFKGDGKLDLALAMGLMGQVSVALGKGDGTFQPPKSYPAGPDCEFVAAADVDGDGKLDLLVVNSELDAGSVTLLHGNGDGTFQQAMKWDAGHLPTTLAIGDFDGDGKPDLAVPSLRDSTVRIILSGSGRSLTFPTGGGPDAVAVGDFNHDGKLDLVTANQTDNTVSVLLGNGDGTFQSKASYPAATEGLSVAVADFNADGKPDLVVGSSGTLSILLGNGNGTFQAPVNYAVGAFPTSLAVADFNGDGKLDVAAVNTGDPAAISIGGVCLLLGKGDGTFQNAIDYNVGISPTSLAVGDFNGDGRPDLAVADLEDRAVRVMLSHKSVPLPVFAAPVPYPAPGPLAGIAVGDFNGDRKLDLAVPDSDNGDVSILLGAGDGTFQPATPVAAGRAPDGGIVVGDFNGDGKPDLAIALTASESQGQVVVLLGKGNGTFQPAAPLRIALGPNALAVGDFNRDGKLDLAVASAGANAALVLLGKGDGTFQAGQKVPIRGIPTDVAAADLNHDGFLDLVVLDGADNVDNLHVLLGHGDGTFTEAGTYPAGPPSKFLQVGDFNGDGTPDAATGADNGTIGVALGRGDGTLGPPHSYGSFFGMGGGSMALGDFNGDGNPDLAVITSGGRSTVTIMLGNGDGSFQAAGDFDSGRDPGLVAAGDFNGDGKPDLAISNVVDHSVSVLLNQTPAAAGSLSGDIDGNGKVDVRDVILLLRFIVGLQSPTMIQQQAADVNGDGKLTIQDALALLRRAVGLG